MGKDIEMSHFGIDQQQEIKDGLQAGLDVSVYAKPEFYAIQMRQIRLGLMAGFMRPTNTTGFRWRKSDWGLNIK